VIVVKVSTFQRPYFNKASPENIHVVF